MSKSASGVRDLDVAVVIVSYKTADLAIRSVRSLQAERSNPGIRVRVVVVDNASGDGVAISQAIELNGWAGWVALVVSARNGGFGYGNNLGTARARSDTAPSYVYLLNPDAEVRPGAIATLARFLEAHPEAGIAGSGIVNSDGSDWPIAFRFPSLLSEVESGLAIGLLTRLLRRWTVARQMAKAPQQVDWICGASMMIRPSVLTAIGGFDENYFLYFEETDLCYRAARAGFQTWYVPASQVMHIRGQSTGVTAMTLGPRRLPAYWFESRRRYFAVTYGLPCAMAIDVVALSAHALGTAKRFLLGRRRTIVPHFLRDLLRSSVLWPKNRRFPPPRVTA